MISVVIPAYNEENNITACLNSLVKQKTKKKFEVIVVDNASTDNTVSVVKKFNKKLNLIVVSEKYKGRGAARAKGFSVASGDIILSTDSDTVVPSNWVDYLSTKLELLAEETKKKKTRQRVVGLTGPCKVNDSSPFKNTVLSIGQPISMHIYRLIMGHYFFSGFNFAITKKAYFQAGGFGKKISGCEDLDLAFKVNKIGKIHFVNNLPVTFSGRRFEEGLIKGLLDYVKSCFNYFVLKKSDSKLSDVR